MPRPARGSASHAAGWPRALQSPAAGKNVDDLPMLRSLEAPENGYPLVIYNITMENHNL